MHHCNHQDCGCGHTHAQGEECGCGHAHTHQEECGCGHDHAHGEECGCGHNHSPLATGESGLTAQQADVLLAIHQRGYLPIARFLLKSSQDEHAFAVALEPVYIADAGEDLDTVKQYGALFSALEEMGLISLDYDMKLKGYGYLEYLQSKVYAYFTETVKEAASQPGFIMDTPVVELGSVALTGEGLSVLEKLAQ